MKNCSCPKIRPPASSKKHWLGFTGGVIPGAALALLPKCPACLAAYLSLLSGFGFSLTTARVLQFLLAALCLISLTLWIATLARCRRTTRPLQRL